MAKAYTSPQLEIYADDVKCSHEHIGRLNEDELFYMRTRGILAAEARILPAEGICIRSTGENFKYGTS